MSPLHHTLKIINTQHRIFTSPLTLKGSKLTPPNQRLKVVILPLDLPSSGPVTHSGKILTTGKSHRKKSDRFSLYDDMDVEKVSRFKYATWNMRGLGEKEEELDKILNENNIKISVIIESKKKLQRNCKEQKRLNTIQIFTVERTDTPDASQEL